MALSHAVSMAPNQNLISLDALVRTRLKALKQGRSRLFLNVFLLVLLALGMLLVRLTDGPRAFFEGALQRGISLYLVLMALPFSFALAKAGARWPVDPGVVVLTKLRGFEEKHVTSSLIRAALRLAMVRAAWVSLPLILFTLLLSLPDKTELTRRVLTGGLFLVIALVASALLALLGLAAARWGKRHGRLLLLVFLLISCFPQLLWHLPSSASLPGMYEAATHAVLRLAVSLRLALALTGALRTGRASDVPRA